MVLVDDMFQGKIDEIFRCLPNVFGIADDTLIVWYDVKGRDHNMALRWVMQIYRQENVNLNKKFNKNKHYFGCTTPHFWTYFLQKWSSCRPKNQHKLIKMLPITNKKELQSFLDIIYYLEKFLPVTVEVCKPFGKLTSTKSAWMWTAHTNTCMTEQRLLSNGRQSWHL